MPNALEHRIGASAVGVTVTAASDRSGDHPSKRPVAVDAAMAAYA